MQPSTCQQAASILASASVGVDAPLLSGTNMSATMPTQRPQLPTIASFGPGKPFSTIQFISESAWPTNLCLNHSKSNWEEWCLQMMLIANCHGFTDWLDGSFP
jgi:hypothetical protein